MNSILIQMRPKAIEVCADVRKCLRKQSAGLGQRMPKPLAR